MSTEEFLRRFEKDELQHQLDMEFDEWIGESRMLKMLVQLVGCVRRENPSVVDRIYDLTHPTTIIFVM